MIGIIDFNAGNLKSITNALKKKNLSYSIIKEPANIENFSHFIIPGVGSYNFAIKEIKIRKLDKFIKDIKQKNKPILGICLGMQILSTYGNEIERVNGLNLIDGEVISIDELNPQKNIHIGWNNIDVKAETKLFDAINLKCEFYFIHSFFFNPKNKKNILCETKYSKKFASGVIKDNTIGLQFHPEKSHNHGLKILENFYNNYNA
tara:strand:- start:112 stop:726 length:615 start_codon:yes stop_codon:yes gene_type:complete